MFHFTVHAPAAQAPEAPTAPSDEEWTFASPKILIVDDVTMNRELAKAMLAPLEVDVTEAGSGLEAVELSQSTPFDLILMDIQMPGMDGLAATRSIRANSDANRQTPIIAFSANVLPTQVQECLAAGMNDHVGKPIELKALLGKIAYWLGAPDG